MEMGVELPNAGSYTLPPPKTAFKNTLSDLKRITSDVATSFNDFSRHRWQLSQEVALQSPPRQRGPAGQLRSRNALPPGFSSYGSLGLPRIQASSSSSRHATKDRGVLRSPSPQHFPAAVRSTFQNATAVQMRLTFHSARDGAMPLSAREAVTAPPEIRQGRRLQPHSARGARTGVLLPRLCAPLKSVDDIKGLDVRHGGSAAGKASARAQKPCTLEEHVLHWREKLLESRDRLVWCAADYDINSLSLRPGTFFNHFEKSYLLTTQFGLARTLAEHDGASGSLATEHFFPRCYDMSNPAEQSAFVLDFRRLAAVKVVLQHLRLDVQRLAGTISYAWNREVLGTAKVVLQNWCTEMDDACSSSQPRGENGTCDFVSISDRMWEHLVQYSEMTEKQFCAAGTDHPEDASRLARELEDLLVRLERLLPQWSLQGGVSGRNVWAITSGKNAAASGKAEFHHRFRELLSRCQAASSCTVQKCMERPLLLFDGKRYDIRQYVLIRSVSPLSVYMLSECHLRLSAAPTSSTMTATASATQSSSGFDRRGRHASSRQIVSLAEFRGELREITGRGAFWEEEVEPQIQQIVLYVAQAAARKLQPRPESFELCCFDFAIDEFMHLWLLGVDSSCSCEAPTLDAANGNDSRGVDPFYDRLLARLTKRMIEVVVLGRDYPDGETPDWLKLCDDNPVEDPEDAANTSTDQVSLQPGLTNLHSTEEEKEDSPVQPVAAAARSQHTAPAEASPAGAGPSREVAAEAAEASQEVHAGIVTVKPQAQGESTAQGPLPPSSSVAHGFCSPEAPKQAVSTSASQQEPGKQQSGQLVRHGFLTPELLGQESAQKGKILFQGSSSTCQQGNASVWPKRSVKGSRPHQPGRQQLPGPHHVGSPLQRAASVPPCIAEARNTEVTEDADDKPTPELRKLQSSSVPPERLVERCALARSTRGLSRMSVKAMKPKGQGTGFEFLADLERRKCLKRFVSGGGRSSDSEEEEGEDDTATLQLVHPPELPEPDSSNTRENLVASRGNTRESAAGAVTGAESIGSSASPAGSPTSKRANRFKKLAKTVTNLSLGLGFGTERRKHADDLSPSSHREQPGSAHTSPRRKTIKLSSLPSSVSEDEEHAMQIIGKNGDMSAHFSRDLSKKNLYYRKSLAMGLGLGLEGSKEAAEAAAAEQVDADFYEMCLNLSKKHRVSMEEVRWRYLEFQQLDANGNKVLTKDEFETAIRRYLNMPINMAIPAHLLESHWTSVDNDSDGTVDFEEFLQWTFKTAYAEEVLVPDPDERNLRRIARANSLSLPDVERIKAVYDQFDTDHSGYIDDEEFRSVLLKLLKVKNPGDISGKKLQRWWREVDVDGSGTVSFEEFLLWYIKYFESA